MEGTKQAVAVVMVVVGLFTLSARAGVTPLTRRSERDTALQSNTLNGGAAGVGATCPEFCPFDYTPVCGNDDVTYTNPCSLSMVACAGNPTLSASYMGACNPFLTSGTTTTVAPSSGGAGGGVEVTCPEVCPQIFAPVCGSDGVTYSSICQLQLASCLLGGNIAVTADTACEEAASQALGAGSAQGEPSITPDEVVPEETAPEAPSCSQQCTRIFFPVCGSDGNTYDNMCILEVADCESRAAGGPSIVVVSEGACDQTGQDNTVLGSNAEGTQTEAQSCSKECTRIFLPLCGSDGVTYNNLCLLEIADCENKAAGGPGVSAVSESACGATPEATPAQPAPEAPSCSQQCTRIFLPVCGSDGVTYNNLCLLEIADCESKAAGGPGVSVASERACGITTETTPAKLVPEAPSCSQQCTRIFLPACGSDGITYNNLCLLEIADCESKAAGGAGVSLVSESACGATTEATAPQPAPEAPSCSQQCTRIFFPVCGSDGNTYDNMCILEVADCESRAAGGPSIIVVSEGACDQTGQDNTVLGSTAEGTQTEAQSCSKECTRIFLPLCGSDGVTYNNLCLLEIADCENKAAGGPGVSAVSESACGATTEVTPAQPAPSCSQQCTRIFLPTCGSDGVTYNNLCLLEIADCESKAAGGPGVSVASDRACGRSEPPVTSRTVEVDVIVSCRRHCSRSLAPVCGSDGVTYDNECLMEDASCRSRREGGRRVYLMYSGPCDTMFESLGSGCREKCSDENEPVCGSDGRTYRNECFLEMSNCGRWARKEQGVYIVVDKPCSGDEDNARTSSEFEPSPNIVLASSLFSSLSSDVHSNSPRSPSPQLSPAPFDSPSSPPVCSEACTREFRPLCGTDGITYNNPCALDVANCKSRARGGLPVVKDFEGPCVAALPRGPVCDVRCDKTHLPVCGSDGETYNNVCLLEHADCLNPFASITVASEGPCASVRPPSAGPAAGLPPTFPHDSEESDEVTSNESFPDTSYAIPV